MLIHEIRWSKPSRVALTVSVMVYAAFMTMVLSTTRMPAVALRAVVVSILAGALILFVFQTLRVTVEGMELRVGFGPFRRRIALQSIDRVAPVRYRFMEWGGYGIRYKRGAVMYNVPGDKGRAVELTLAGGKRVLFSAEDPDAVCLAIREQRALMPY